MPKLNEQVVTTDAFGDVIIRELDGEDYYWAISSARVDGSTSARIMTRQFIKMGTYLDGKLLFGDDSDDKVRALSREDYARLANAAINLNLPDSPKKVS